MKAGWIAGGCALVLAGAIALFTSGDDAAISAEVPSEPVVKKVAAPMPERELPDLAPAVRVAGVVDAGPDLFDPAEAQALQHARQAATALEEAMRRP